MGSNSNTMQNLVSTSSMLKRISSPVSWQDSSQCNLDSLKNEQALQAKMILSQGMKNEFQQIIKFRPKQYPKLIDSMKTKFPQDVIIFGKPNVIMN